jgi:esterase/lipase
MATGNGSKGQGDDRVSAGTVLALSAWDLERPQRTLPETPRARVIRLRAHQRLQVALEERRGIPPAHRSFIGIQEGARAACLLVHGVLGSPADLRPLAEHLHASGLTVYLQLLPGYGLDTEEPPQVMWRASLQAVKVRFQLLRRLYRQVHVIGHGMGAALAIHLARQETVASLALLAPALIPRVTLVERLFLRLKLHRLRWLRPRLGWNPEVLEAMESARTQVGRLRLPIYAAQCDDDERISPISLRVLQKRTRHRASRFRAFASGGHDILAAHGAEELHAEILDFVRGGR